MQKLTSLSLGKGVRLTCITTDQFKTSCMSALLSLPLDGAYRSHAALLPQVLYGISRDYPGRRAVTIRLQELYGARVVPTVRKCGEAQLIGFSASVIDDRFASSETNSLAADTAELLGSLLLHPGLFPAEEVHTEALHLAERVQALRNDKRDWAVRRMYRLMCAGEAYGNCELGEEHTLREMRPDDLHKAYQAILRTAPLELFYCGSLEAERAAEIFSSFLERLTRTEDSILHPVFHAPYHVGHLHTYMEDEPVKQGKLTIGLRTGITAFDAEYPALMLFNACFGGTTGSRLFRHVREELSLCYYASSQVAKLKGTMAVTCGIDNESECRARAEIFRQLRDMQTGGITAEELDAARTSVLTGLQSMNDSPLVLEHYYQTQAVAGLTQSLDELCQRVQAVTLEQVTAAAAKVKPDTIYFMRGAAEHE